jgi:hypothetical protein
LPSAEDKNDKITPPLCNHISRLQKICLDPDPTKSAILDTGTTGHYFMLATQCCSDIEPTHRAINVSMPDGPTIKSTHEGNLPFHNLPIEARKAEIMVVL